MYEPRLVTSARVPDRKHQVPLAHIFDRELNGFVYTICGKQFNGSIDANDGRGVCERCQQKRGMVSGDWKKFVRSSCETSPR